jgi:hypothetical protein
MQQDQAIPNVPSDRARPLPCAVASNVELPPPLPPGMLDHPAVDTDGFYADVTSPGGNREWRWSLSLPTRADMFNRARLGQVVLGGTCFWVYAMSILGFGRDQAAYLIARPLLPGILIPLLVVIYVRAFRAQAFGRGFILGIVLLILFWIVSGLSHSLSAGA